MISLIIVNIHLIIGAAISESIHRESFLIKHEFNSLFEAEDVGDDNDADTFDQQDDEKMEELNDSIS